MSVKMVGFVCLLLLCAVCTVHLALFWCIAAAGHTALSCFDIWHIWNTIFNWKSQFSV